MEVLISKIYDNFSKLYQIDPIITLLVLSLFIVGFIILYSAGGGHAYPFAAKQIIRFSLFLPLIILIICLDIKFIFKYLYIAYFIGIILLVLSFVLSLATGSSLYYRLLFLSLSILTTSWLCSENRTS